MRASTETCWPSASELVERQHLAYGSSVRRTAEQRLPAGGPVHTGLFLLLHDSCLFRQDLCKSDLHP